MLTMALEHGINLFLSSTKSSLQQFLKSFQVDNRVHKVNIIIGNPSCDLDSCISAIVLAWAKTQVEVGTTLHVPVMNVERNNFHTRTEITFLLQKMEIKQKHLLFKDEVDLNKLSQLGKDAFRITLVDHHVLSGADKYLEAFLTEIVDHRVKSREISSGTITNISLVGSCCTLVAENMLSSIDRKSITSEIETLLLGAILTDTNNLSVRSGKVTQRDIDVVNVLRKERSDNDLCNLHEMICDAKYSIDGLTTVDLLLKDPKWIQNSTKTVMFSTLHLRMGDFLQRSDVHNIIESYCNEHNLQGWIGLAGHSYSFKSIAVYAPDKSIREKIVNELLSASDLKIQISNEDKQYESLQCLRMYNMQRTRKQVLPVVDSLLQKMESHANMPILEA